MLLGASPEANNEYSIISKLDKNANLIFQKVYPSNTYTGVSIVELHDGYLVLSTTTDNGNDGPRTQNSRGGADYWLEKLDFEGNRVWNKTYGGEGNDIAKGILESPFYDNVYTIFGSSDSNNTSVGEKSENGLGGKDLWIIQIDENGTKIWDKTFGGTGNDLPIDMIALTDYYLLFCESNSPTSPYKESPPNGKVWQFAFFPNGEGIGDVDSNNSIYGLHTEGFENDLYRVVSSEHNGTKFSFWNGGDLNLEKTIGFDNSVFSQSPEILSNKVVTLENSTILARDVIDENGNGDNSVAQILELNSDLEIVEKVNLLIGSFIPPEGGDPAFWEEVIDLIQLKDGSLIMLSWGEGIEDSYSIITKFYSEGNLDIDSSF